MATGRDERIADLQIAESPSVLKVLAQQHITSRLERGLDDQCVPKRQGMLLMQCDAAQDEIGRLGDRVVRAPKPDEFGQFRPRASSSLSKFMFWSVRCAALTKSQFARCFSFDFCLAFGIRRSNSWRSGISSPIRSEMRLHTLRHRSTIVASAVR